MGERSRWRAEARDFLEFVAAPGVAALLPWSLGRRWLSWLARYTQLYGPTCTAALAQAQARGIVSDTGADWITERRLTTLVDHGDYFLERVRSDRWMARHLQVQGQWPAAGQPGILLTFHWGAGMWALRHAATHGIRARMLVAAPTRSHFAGRSVAYHYIRSRVGSIARIFQRPTLDVSVSLRPALEALRANEQIMAVVDVPADQTSASQPIRLMGMPARAPKALFRLAVQQQIPVTVFVTGMESATGMRTLRIQQLGIYQDMERLIEDVYAELERAMQHNSAAWHFWSEAERFFRA
jgi:lauroyl/myristoyl acyltransferase